MQKWSLIYLILTGFFLLVHHRSNLLAQPFILDKKITAVYDNITLKDILSDITVKTSVRFSYSPRKIPEDLKLSVSFSQTPLHEALDRLFQSLPISYEIIDDYIILKKTSEKPGGQNEAAIKRFTFSGYVKDSATGEFLPGATLYIKGLSIGTTTNSYGFFSLFLSSGEYKIEISYVGYVQVVQSIELNSNVRADFTLSQQLHRLEEVVISSLPKNELNFKKRASQNEVSPFFVAQEPALMGEPDVIKSLEFQPGIVFYGDGSSYFHVRGGNYDQNLVILDEAAIFNPSHLLGIFSPIIPDAIKSVDIYKADFPVCFGGRLSSVIDIHTKDGNKNNFSASGNIGLISARGTIEGPIKKNTSSYFFSFRKSYFDAYLKPLLPSLQGLYFYDFTAKINLKLGICDRLFFTFYKGKDVFRIKTGNDDSNGLNWGNTGSTVRWNHIFGSRMFLNSSLCLSNYDYYLYTSINNNIYWNSKISSVSFKNEWSFYATPKLTCRFGINLSTYDFNPGNYFNQASANNIQVSPVKSSEVAIYAGAEQELLPRLRLNYGMRLLSWADYGESFVIHYDNAHNPDGVKYYKKNEIFYTHFSLEPRISVSFKTGEMSSVKMSYDRTNQFLNLITNSISPFNSLEVWLPAGPNIKPQYADIIDCGYSALSGAFNFQTDIFYKKMYNQIGYKYHASMLVNPSIEGELRQGYGSSYGFEVSIKKESGKLTGQAEYTYSRAFLKINELNAGRTFPATYDRPHNLNLSVAYQARPRWLLTANYHIMSGLRITTPTSFYDYRGYQVPLYSEQNNDQLPAYSRFDISTTIRLNKQFHKFSHSITFAIINLFANKNPIFIYFNKHKTPDGTLVIPMDKLNPEDLTSSIRYTYGFIPSISYQFRF